MLYPESLQNTCSILQFEHVSPLPSYAKKEIKPDTDQQTPYACYCCRRRRRDSVAGIATRYGLDGPGI